jgi:hypothetical protein
MSLKMEQFIRGNGGMDSGTAEASKFGKMGVSMKGKYLFFNFKLDM